MRYKQCVHRGFSLIQLVVVIAATAIVFGVAVLAFTRFLAVRSSGQDHLERTVQTARLAEQFRRDVWASREASPAGDNKLTLAGDNGHRVEYEIAGDAICRTVLENDEQKMRETYQPPGTMPLKFEHNAPKTVMIIAPLKPREIEGEDRHGKPLRIVATLARDLRFQNAEDR